MMKQAAVVLMVAGSSAVYAQSSVTLYGRLDNGIQFESGLPNGHKVDAESGYWAPTIFGLKGKEDLGGGTSAVFRMEAAIDSTNGSSIGSLFSRVATVGITNDRWGNVRFGRLGVTEVQVNSYYIDPQFYWLYSISTLVRGRNWTSASNGFEYVSPTLGGLTVEGQYALANSTSWNAGNPGSGPSLLGQPQGRSDGLMLRYSGASFQAMAIYDEIRDPNGKFSNVYFTSRSLTVGGTYTFGQLHLYAGYQHLSSPDASNEGYFGSSTPTTLPAGASLPTRVDHEWIGANWQATPATTISAAVYHANVNNGNGNATLFTLGGSYNLSKTTLLYTEIGYVKNSETSNVGLDGGFGDSYGANANNDPLHGGANTSPNYGYGQFGVFAGIVHQF
ncbi:porin [Paraburkholderia sediminicola]|nr:porin [Paraburkholderia sediminicola]